MGTIANAKVTHYYNCYNGDFIGCLQFKHKIRRKSIENVLLSFSVVAKFATTEKIFNSSFAIYKTIVVMSILANAT